MVLLFQFYILILVIDKMPVKLELGFKVLAYIRHICQTEIQEDLPRQTGKQLERLKDIEIER